MENNDRNQLGQFINGIHPKTAMTNKYWLKNVRHFLKEATHVGL